MKILPIFASIVLSAVCAMANTVIEIRSYLPSSPDPCFTVLKNGKHASEMPVRLYEPGASPGKFPYWSSLTNKDGIACSPELPDGKYEIYVVSGRRSAELDIDVTKSNKVSGFEIALVIPDQLRAAAAAPVATWVHEFRGQVEDANGGVIPRVKIEVLRKEPADEIDGNSVVKTESNERGQVSCDLEGGLCGDF